MAAGDASLKNRQSLEQQQADILQKYPSVSLNYASSYIGDIISKNKSNDVFPSGTGQNDITKAVNQVKKDTPEIYNKYKSSFDKLTPHDLTGRGVFGGIESGLDEIGFGIDYLFTTDAQRAAQNK